MTKPRYLNQTIHVKKALSKFDQEFEPQLIEVLWRILADRHSLGHALLAMFSGNIVGVCRDCEEACRASSSNRAANQISSLIEKANQIAIDSSAYQINSQHLIAAMIDDKGHVGQLLKKYIRRDADWVMRQAIGLYNSKRPPIRDSVVSLRIYDPVFIERWSAVFKPIRKIFKILDVPTLLSWSKFNEIVSEFNQFRKALRTAMLYYHELDASRLPLEKWQHYLNYTLMMLGGVYDDSTTLNLDFFFYSFKQSPRKIQQVSGIFEENERFYEATLAEYNEFLDGLILRWANSTGGAHEA